MALSESLNTGLRRLPFCVLVDVACASECITSPDGTRCDGLDCFRRAIGSRKLEGWCSALKEQ
jgi:hypothetical protein